VYWKEYKVNGAKRQNYGWLKKSNRAKGDGEQRAGETMQTGKKCQAVLTIVDCSGVGGEGTAKGARQVHAVRPGTIMEELEGSGRTCTERITEIAKQTGFLKREQSDGRKGKERGQPREIKNRFSGM